MGYLLRPGMSMLRRLSVAGKFGLVSVLLLVPILIGLVSTYQTTTDQIAQAETERHGLAFVAPLSDLLIQVSHDRVVAASGAEPGARWRQLVNAADDVNARYGEELGVEQDWSRARAEVVAVYAPAVKPAQRADLAQNAADTLQRMLTQVADGSDLTVDPQLFSHYLISTLVDQLPRLMITDADVRVLRLEPASASSAAALQLANRSFQDSWHDLALNLSTALSTMSGSPLREQVNGPLWALQSRDSASGTTNKTAGEAGSTTTVPAPTATSTKSSAGLSSSTSLTDSDSTANGAATALSRAVTSGVDSLLQDRQDDLRSQRAKPLMLTLALMLIVFYLLMSLFRAIATDVSSVLADISTVTNGGIHQTTPLESADEFGQMSRAVTYARDRLTALVGALKYQATHDDLTALANRSLFNEKVEEAISQGPIAVILIDLDGFKDLNDSFGHDFGDRLLRGMAARIHRNVPRRSVVARLGGDEFAVLVTDQRVTQDPGDVITRLSEALAQPLIVDSRSVRMQTGIGYALAAPSSGEDAATPQTGPDAATTERTDAATAPGGLLRAGVPGIAEDDEPPLATAASAVELIRNADVALSYAKQMGKGHQVRFEPRMHDHTRNRTELSADLVAALEREELFVLYQPLVDLNTNLLHGVEALVRWRHPTRGLISPDVFIPLAEATGQITTIGKWVLNRALTDLGQWRQEFPDARDLVMEVNLATEQLTDPQLVSDVRAVIRDSGVNPAFLVLEITESALVKDLEMALRRMTQLSALGVRIALDDFGTGYSSLSYLRRLPVTVMKIDKSFMRDETPQGRALLRSIIDLGTGQGMQIVAEGVEQPVQAAQLRRAGAHIGQGYLWAPAIQSGQIRRILAAGGRMGPPVRSRRAVNPSSSAIPAQRSGADSSAPMRH